MRSLMVLAGVKDRCQKARSLTFPRSSRWVSTGNSLVDERHTPALCHLGQPLSAFRKRCAVDHLARLNDNRLAFRAIYQGIDRTVLNRQFVADWFGCSSHFRFLFLVPVISATVIVPRFP